MSEIINFYTLNEVKALATKYHNPNFDVHKLTIPFRMLIVGSSGSGKTNVLLNLIHQMNNTFNKIFIFTRDIDEPLYLFLRTKIPSDVLYIYSGIDELRANDLETFFGPNKKDQILTIFDDMVLEKDQTPIEELYIRGRKMNGGISLCYLSQTYTPVPKVIRQQINYLILRKVSSNRDIMNILKESSMGINKETLIRVFNMAVQDEITNFLLIDLKVDPKMAFRSGFDKIIKY